MIVFVGALRCIVMFLCMLLVFASKRLSLLACMVVGWRSIVEDVRQDKLLSLLLNQLKSPHFKPHFAAFVKISQLPIRQSLLVWVLGLTIVIIIFNTVVVLVLVLARFLGVRVLALLG